MMCKELQPHEFTDRLEPIFRYVEREAGRQPKSSAHMFTQWRKWMELGLARTWEAKDCVLGAIFAPHLWEGECRAYVHFWFALPNARRAGRAIRLLRACEHAARKAGCDTISAAAYNDLSPEKTKYLYERLGYRLSETIFTKKLV